MSNSINLASNPTSLSGIDHSNTPVTHDEFGITLREFSSHERKGFVVFVDFLGIKGIWKRVKPENVFTNMKDIAGKFEKELGMSVLSQFKTYFTTLSDTVIITCECTLKYINSVFDILINPFLYSMKLRFPLRGAISYGKYFLSNRLIIGPAIDEAAHSHNKLEIIGICTSSNLSKRMAISTSVLPLSNNYTYYPRIPTKNGNYNGWVLDWRKCGRELLPFLQYELNNQSDDGVKSKYQNTIDFLTS